MDWLPWTPDAFARAARERKPVLLSITASWCQACHEMDRTTYADARVEALIHAHFIPVRIDTDRRPDINERYNLGGWPTTAFLTPAGEILGGGTFVPADRMASVLRRVADAFASRAEWPAGEARAESAAGDPGDDRHALDRVFETFDEEHGGFGIEPKFPLTAPLHLALTLYREDGDTRWIPVVERTLDAMADGGLRDAASGGYFRYAVTRDWQLPHREKLLETNAALLAVFADAAAALGRRVDRDRVSDLVAFITRELRAPGGGFAGSDADPMAYMDSNAAAASALLAASTVLEEPDIARDALASFERVVLLCYRPGHGVAHLFDGEARVRGLLADQVATIGALLDAHAMTGDEPYGMMAEEIAHYMVRALWDPRGGFRDRAPSADDIGLLKTGRRPFVGNCEAARALARLVQASGDHDFVPRAQGALAAAAGSPDHQGPLAAQYLLAVRDVGR